MDIFLIMWHTQSWCTESVLSVQVKTVSVFVGECICVENRGSLQVGRRNKSKRVTGVRCLFCVFSSVFVGTCADQ